MGKKYEWLEELKQKNKTVREVKKLIIAALSEKGLSIGRSSTQRKVLTGIVKELCGKKEFDREKCLNMVEEIDLEELVNNINTTSEEGMFAKSKKEDLEKQMESIITALESIEEAEKLRQNEEETTKE